MKWLALSVLPLHKLFSGKEVDKLSLSVDEFSLLVGENSSNSTLISCCIFYITNTTCMYIKNIYVQKFN